MKKVAGFFVAVVFCLGIGSGTSSALVGDPVPGGGGGNTGGGGPTGNPVVDAINRYEMVFSARAVEAGVPEGTRNAVYSILADLRARYG